MRKLDFKKIAIFPNSASEFNQVVKIYSENKFVFKIHEVR